LQTQRAGEQRLHSNAQLHAPESCPGRMGTDSKAACKTCTMGSTTGLDYDCGVIAVEIPITEHPPHRSQRARFTHWAPTLGV
jgi:radical SAM superfamily enzyme